MDGLDDISQEEIDAFAASGQDLGPGEDSIFVAAFAEAMAEAGAHGDAGGAAPAARRGTRAAALFSLG